MKQAAFQSTEVLSSRVCGITIGCCVSCCLPFSLQGASVTYISCQSWYPLALSLHIQHCKCILATSRPTTEGSNQVLCCRSCRRDNNRGTESPCSTNSHLKRYSSCCMSKVGCVVGVSTESNGGGMNAISGHAIAHKSFLENRLFSGDNHPCTYSIDHYLLIVLSLMRLVIIET
jgi:hypothetical protein